MFTVDEDGETQEGQVALPLDGVPADVRVSLSQQHGTALQTAPGQVGDHLRRIISTVITELHGHLRFGLSGE